MSALQSVQFTVRGVPVAQGTARAFVAGGRARIATDANRLSSPLGAWRAAIRTEAQAAMREQPTISGPVSVIAWFTLPRPVSLPKRVTEPDAKPDIDKLLRALLDGITGVVVADDALVVAVSAVKQYGPDPGVTVTVARRGVGRRR